MAELAQVNVAVPRAPLDDPARTGFANAFDAVARLAEAAPGFVRRLGAGSGHAVLATSAGDRGGRQRLRVAGLPQPPRVRLPQRPRAVPAAPPRLVRADAAAVHRSAVGGPGVGPALARLQYLRDHGPSPQAFSLLRRFTVDGRRIR
ncbi:DUF3291 domain-containing protein [Amycolatopsis mongoliensis]|uniref:DUF3291 domain-containing protein n=1 Tax=Amycolatopsis mongoliensis TaxID=715475 RepID=A0A9Y2JJL6_9PSEU|nr:DUF3291 domain-containing protein [Amycolatopsis sp. 4-36]WIX99242.1 DUF3291 domain-containing protein [Amycolatopsis sp. 4-36]